MLVKTPTSASFKKPISNEVGFFVYFYFTFIETFFYMKKTIVFLFLFLFSLLNYSSAQEWMGKTNPTTSNFFEIQKAFYNYYSENKREVDTEEENDDEFAKFKRWEYYWETRVDANGNFPPADVLWKELENYTANQQGTKNYKSVNAANWSFSGPSTFTFNGTGGGIGRVNCIAFHPTLPNTFWVGTPDGGLWKTTDAGATWTTTTDNLPVLGISDIAVDYSNPNIIYIATGDGETALITPASSKSVGVLKSLDGGITFNPTGLSINITAQKLTNRILIHPVNPQILLVAASDGIWRTTNGGSTWTNQQAGWFTDLEFKPSDANYVYASTLSNAGTSQIFRSTDNGITWTQVTNLTGINRIDLAVTPALPNVVSALCANTSGLGGLQGVYSSANSGASFTQVIVGTCTNNMLCSKYNGAACGGQGVYDLAYTIHPTNTNEVWIAGVNNWKTTDGGATWNLNTFGTTDTLLNPNNVPYLHSDKHRIVYHPLNPSYIFTCSDAGVHLTNDGGATWFDLSNGLGISQMYRIGTSATVAGKVLCGLQDNGLKQRSSYGWQSIQSGDNMEEIIDPIDTNVQYSCALTGYLYRTMDNWATKTPICTNIPGFSAYLAATGFGPGAWITPFVMDPANHQTLYIGFNDIWKTTDQGNTWSLISNFGSSHQLRFMAIAPSNNQVIYTSTYDTLFATANGGGTWSYNIVSNITGNAFDKISYITVSPTNPLMLWVTISGFDAGNKVFKSTNGGTSWTNVSGTLPNIPVNCSVYENGSNDGVYVGTDLGVFYRDNNLTDWIPYNAGLPNVQVNDLKISYIDNKLWAATFGRSLWESDLYSFVGINDVSAELNNLDIYPNPSNGQFQISNFRFQIESIKIYNVMGEEVISHWSLVNSKNITIDMNGFSSGIYFAKIVSDKGSCVKKIIISKE